MSTHEEHTLTSADSSFRISRTPIVEKRSDQQQPQEDFADLPHSYGPPTVFAMARDPNTLFVYWDIDWPKVFAAVPPANRKVYLRLRDADGAEVSFVPVEPMSRGHELNAQPRSSYRAEIGYFDQIQNWYCVATSQKVETPVNKMGALASGDFALVPFHITFQKLTELFRATQTSEGSLVQSLARLEKKSLRPAEFAALGPEQREIYRAMKASVSQRTYFPRRSLPPAEEARLQKKLESVLGFSGAPSSASLGRSSRF